MYGLCKSVSFLDTVYFPYSNLLNIPSFYYREGNIFISSDHFSFPMLDLTLSPSFLLSRESSVTPSDCSLIGKVSYFLFFMNPYDTFSEKF